MQKSTSITNLAISLAMFQKTVGVVKKESENPYFKSKYADLASIIAVIKEPLAANGLSFSQFPSGDNQMTTILMHISGEWLEDTVSFFPVDTKPQSLGSAITYIRRYALSSVLGISTEEDDDGNVASDPKSKTVSNKLASPKQKEYLASLIRKSGKPMPDAEFFNKLTMDQAKDQIDKALKGPSNVDFPDDVINEHD